MTRLVLGSTQAASLAGPVRVPDPGCDLRQFEPVSDGLVLAAIDRAERHGEQEGESARIRVIADHLGFLHGHGTTRGLRPNIDALIEAGDLLPLRAGANARWVVTDGGRRRVARELQAGEIVLPEAPQHRVWRHARENATRRIGGFREQFRQALDDAESVRKAEQVDSDAWFGLAQRLLQICWQLGSATYCLNEWREPQDACVDIDDYHTPGDDALDPEELYRRQKTRVGRRQTRDWQDPQ